MAVAAAVGGVTVDGAGVALVAWVAARVGVLVATGLGVEVSAATWVEAAVGAVVALGAVVLATAGVALVEDDDVESELFSADALSDVVLDAVEEDTDEAALLDDDITMLSDDETCGVEGVAGGVESSA